MQTVCEEQETLMEEGEQDAEVYPAARYNDEGKLIIASGEDAYVE